MTVPIVSVVGPSNSGKTSLVCALVSRLARKGYSVAVAKHAPHGHDTGPESVDSHRIASAGASRVSVVSPGVTSRFEKLDDDAEESFDELLDWAKGCDLLLLEGWKRAAFPKVVVGDSTHLDIAPPVIADFKTGHGIPDAGIANLAGEIEALMKNSKDQQRKITLRIDGEDLRLKRFPAAALAGVVTGYLETLDGVSSDWNTLEIEISKE